MLHLTFQPREKRHNDVFMVRKGEYLERAVVIPGSHGTLEGLFHRGAKRPAVLIAGETMESTLIAELAWAVTRRGHPTLRFNYRGVGASPGAPSDDPSELEKDLAGAAEHLRNTVDDRALAIVAAEQSAAVAARRAINDEMVELLVLIAPDPSALPEAFRSHPREVVFVVPQGEEAAVKAALSTYARALPNARVAVIPEADRAFIRGLVELGRVVADAVAPPGMITI